MGTGVQDVATFASSFIDQLNVEKDNKLQREALKADTEAKKIQNERLLEEDSNKKLVAEKFADSEETLSMSPKVIQQFLKSQGGIPGPDGNFTVPKNIYKNVDFANYITQRVQKNIADIVGVKPNADVDRLKKELQTKDTQKQFGGLTLISSGLNDPSITVDERAQLFKSGIIQLTGDSKVTVTPETHYQSNEDGTVKEITKFRVEDGEGNVMAEKTLQEMGSITEFVPLFESVIRDFGPVASMSEGIEQKGIQQKEQTLAFEQAVANYDKTQEEINELALNNETTRFALDQALNPQNSNITSKQSLQYHKDYKANIISDTKDLQSSADSLIKGLTNTEEIQGSTLFGDIDLDAAQKSKIKEVKYNNENVKGAIKEIANYFVTDQVDIKRSIFLGSGSNENAQREALGELYRLTPNIAGFENTIKKLLADATTLDIFEFTEKYSGVDDKGQMEVTEQGKYIDIGGFYLNPGSLSKIHKAAESLRKNEA